MSVFESSAEQRYRIIHVFAPFAAAYLLSYVMRSVNAVLSGPLTDEFALTPSQLGLLSSSYFLTFAAMQIPLGALLDRRGPKEVEVVLLHRVVDRPGTDWYWRLCLPNGLLQGLSNLFSQRSAGQSCLADADGGFVWRIDCHAAG